MRIANSPTWGGLFGAATLLVVVAVLGACGSTPGASPAPTTAAGDPLAVGPYIGEPPVIDPAVEPNSSLQVSEDQARARLRLQAGLAHEVGAGWDALSTAADEATDAAAAALAAEFAIDLPVSTRNVLLASVVPPNRRPSSEPASVAASLALLGAALSAGQSLGLGGTLETTVSDSNTTTKGDSVAVVTVEGQGKSVSSGSRVTADFSFALNGTVTNSATGAVATMTGSATAHIEIDGCPDANGSSKGKVNLSSSESASNGVGWTRDLTGDFDITVDDEANISKLTVDADAQELVEPSEADGEPAADGHDLGIQTHAEFSAGPGFSGMEHNGDAMTLEVTHAEDAESIDLAPLFTSALSSVLAGAHILGRAAEEFWRDGKCIEVIVSPEGGDVDGNSTTEVVAKVKHRIEGNELNKPVEATLGGVKAIDPAGQKQPAPATFTYTAGPKVRDRGEVEFKSVSNRGIGKQSVTFTVAAPGWMTTATSPTGDVTGTKCDGLGGEWRIEGTQLTGAITITTQVVVTINEQTLEGTFDFHKDQVGLGTVTTSQSNGAARIVLNEDGSVTMTLDAAPILVHTENQFGGSADTTIPGDKLTYPWPVATGEACSTN